MFPGETVLSGCKLATVEDFEVLRSGAGYYIGTLRNGCPCTRETVYFGSIEEAEEVLALFKKTGYLRKQR